MFLNLNLNPMKSLWSVLIGFKPHSPLILYLWKEFIPFLLSQEKGQEITVIHSQLKII